MWFYVLQAAADRRPVLWRCEEMLQRISEYHTHGNTIVLVTSSTSLPMYGMYHVEEHTPQQQFFQIILVTTEVSDVYLVSMVKERGLCLDINLWIWRWIEALMATVRSITGDLTMLIQHLLFWTFWPPNLQMDLRWVLGSLLFQTGTGRQEVSICK